MSNDLEKFLQQAAERLAQKANAARGASGSARAGQPPGQSQPSGAPLPSSNLRRREPPSSLRRERVAPTAEIIEAQIIEDDEKRRRALREAGSDPLSTIDTRPSLAQTISQADERMGEHVHQVFDHQLTQLRAPSTSLAASSSSHSDHPSEVTSRTKAVSPLIETLRNPESLRAAFIVGEIFKRKQ